MTNKEKVEAALENLREVAEAAAALENQNLHDVVMAAGKRAAIILEHADLAKLDAPSADAPQFPGLVANKDLGAEPGASINAPGVLGGPVGAGN